MPASCPDCHGSSFLMETGPDGRIVTVCAQCGKTMPFDPPEEVNPGFQKIDSESGDPA